MCTRLLIAEEMISGYFQTNIHEEHLLHLLLFRDYSVLYLNNENAIY